MVYYRLREYPWHVASVDSFLFAVRHSAVFLVHVSVVEQELLGGEVANGARNGNGGMATLHVAPQVAGRLRHKTTVLTSNDSCYLIDSLF